MVKTSRMSADVTWLMYLRNLVELFFTKLRKHHQKSNLIRTNRD